MCAMLIINVNFKTKLNLTMRILLILGLAFCVNLSKAQNTGKKHFIIHRIDQSADLSKYEQAASNWNQLDNYRFYDKRRTISFTDSKVTIELYSAKELLEMFGKQIAPGTIMDEKNIREIAFEITMDGKGLKPQFIK